MLPRVSRRFIIYPLFSLLLAACSPTPAVATVLPSPSPASSQSTLTQTIYIAETGQPAIYIDGLGFVEPGVGSTLASPIHVAVQVPSASNALRVELRGANGRLLARKLLRAEAGILELDIDFEIKTASELGRLLISLDDEFGRTQQLVSIQVHLLAEGESVVLASQQQQMVTIIAPEEGARVAGGHVTISGTVVGEPGRPLNIQLVTREGRVLATDDVYPQFEDGSAIGTFALELSADIDEGTWVRVGVSQTVNSFLISLNSVEIWLAP